MKIYQDLEKLGQDEKERMEFAASLVREHVGSDAYKVATVAEEYYSKHNPTIERFQKFLYDLGGHAYPDLFSANYKLKTLFFRRFVLQQTQYVLSNGVTFEQETTKDKLSKDFDSRLQQLAKKAMVDGVAFGFWNAGDLQVLSFADTSKDPGFAPLYDGDTGELRAGVRYWSIGEESESAKRYTLYEQDGYTDYIQRKGKEIEQMTPKRSYIEVVQSSQMEGETVVEGYNYPGFPIIPMYANDLGTSEIVGIQETIDCYDFIKSGLANNIDDSAGFYWLVKGAGGMNDVDLAQFLDRLRTVHAAVVDSEEGGGIEPHTLEIPYQAREAMLSRLRSDLYEDFQLLDIEKALTGNLTATAIRMAYQAQDDKCSDFEYQIRDFIGRLLDLVGIEDEPSFKWNRVANQLEETQMVISAATYLDDQAVLDHLPWLTPEEVDAIMERKAADELDRNDNLEPPEGVTEDGQGAPGDGEGTEEPGAENSEIVPPGE